MTRRKGLSVYIDRLMECTFRRASPVFRSAMFRSSSFQIIVTIVISLLLVLLGIIFLISAFISSDGTTTVYEFTAEPDEPTVHTLTGIENMDEMNVSIKANRTIVMEFFVCHEGEYEKWVDGDREADDLDVVIYYNNTIKNRTFSSVVEGDGTFYMVAINHDSGNAEIEVRVKTMHPPQYFTSVCSLFMFIIAALLIAASSNIVRKQRMRNNMPYLSEYKEYYEHSHRDIPNSSDPRFRQQDNMQDTGGECEIIRDRQENMQEKRYDMHDMQNNNQEKQDNIRDM